MFVVRRRSCAARPARESLLRQSGKLCGFKPLVSKGIKINPAWSLARTTLDCRRTTSSSMRIAYLDCSSGISGDMFLGALIDAGVPPQIFEQTVAALQVGAKIEFSRVNRSGISAAKVDVVVNDDEDTPRADRTRLSDSYHRRHEEHSHSHSHEHGGTHEHQHEHHHAQEHHHGRGLVEIREIIHKAAILSETAKQTAIAIFEKLGEAEAKIHNVAVEKIHFHEVGAVDALVDSGSDS